MVASILQLENKQSVSNYSTIIIKSIENDILLFHFGLHVVKEILKPSVLPTKLYNFCITNIFFLFFTNSKIFFQN